MCSPWQIWLGFLMCMSTKKINNVEFGRIEYKFVQWILCQLVNNWNMKYEASQLP